MDTEQSTYARGPNRVDYILASNRLLEFVLRQGCEPFNARIFSDHRGIFVDFSYPGFFNLAPNVLVPPCRRNLIYNCPRQIRRYLTLMDKYLVDHNMIERAQQLATHDRDDKFAEKFDHDMTIGLLAAESACKNFHRSPWSIQLHSAMTKKYILLRRLSHFLTGRDMHDPIARLQAKLVSPVPLPSSLQLTKVALQEAQRDCRAVVRQARDLAKAHQDMRITAKELANPDKDPDQIAKEIRRRDSTREMWKRIPSSKPPTLGGLSSIKIPVNPTDDPKHPDTIFKSVVDPPVIESLLLQRNKTHFSQAKDTPLASPIIADSLGWGGQTNVSDRLLDGSVDPSDITTDGIARDILRHCKRMCYHP